MYTSIIDCRTLTCFPEKGLQEIRKINDSTQNLIGAAIRDDFMRRVKITLKLRCGNPT